MADDDIAVAIDGEDVTTEGETTQADPVAELKSQFDALKVRSERDAADKAAALRRASAAEAAAQAAQRETATVRTEAIATEASSLDSAISSATSAIEAAKKEIKAAGEAGDHGAQADAYDRLAAARADLAQLNASKRDVDVRKAEAARPAARTETPIEATSGDPFESYVAKFTAPTAQWMRDHKEWVTDARKSLKLTAAHSDALSEGLEPDSPAYFDHVEKFIGIKKAPELETRTSGADKSVPVKPHARRAPVAPVSGSNGMNAGDNVVRLSKAQAEAATDGTIVWNYPDPTGKNRWKVGDPIGHQEMARRVKAQTEQGLFEPNRITV